MDKPDLAMKERITALENSAWTLHCVISTLAAAIPVDTEGCEVPTKSTLLHIKELSRNLADGLAEATDYA